MAISPPAPPDNGDPTPSEITEASVEPTEIGFSGGDVTNSAVWTVRRQSSGLKPTFRDQRGHRRDNYRLGPYHNLTIGFFNVL